MEPGVAVIERHATIEFLVELEFRSCEAEAPILRRDLQALTGPLHDVAVADNALCRKAQMREGPPERAAKLSPPRTKGAPDGHLLTPLTGCREGAASYLASPEAEAIWKGAGYELHE